MSSPSQTPPITVVIVNWNGMDHLPACIGALREQTRRPHGMVVVDNGSIDGSLEWAQEQADVDVLPLGRNTGFAPAANIGIEHACTADVLLLNNDVKVDSELVRCLADALVAAGPRCGYATARLVRTADGTIDAAGAFLDEAGVPGHRGMGAGADDPSYLDSAVVHGACAAATLYRRVMLEDVGAFPAEFFAYYEDADLGVRASLRGWHGTYVPEALALHEVSATSSRTPGLKFYYGIRNSWWLLVRCIPTALLPRVLARHLVVHLVWLGSAWRRGHLGLALRAEVDAARGLRRCLRERELVQDRATASAADFRATLAPPQTAGAWSRLVRRRPR